MKKILIFGWMLLFFIPICSYGDFDSKGAISNWCFTPLQLDASLARERKLFDESTHSFISLGLFLLRQKSAVISIAPIANTLESNYGIQLNPLIMGTATDRNYGFSFGFENYSKRNYALQLGMINYSFAGDKVEKYNERTQFVGLNIADFLYIGLANFSNRVQIGLINFSKEALFQVGLINYNPASYVPWMPIINFNMGRKKN